MKFKTILWYLMTHGVDATMLSKEVREIVKKNDTKLDGLIEKAKLAQDDVKKYVVSERDYVPKF